MITELFFLNMALILLVIEVISAIFGFDLLLNTSAIGVIILVLSAIGIIIFRWNRI